MRIQADSFKMALNAKTAVTNSKTLTKRNSNNNFTKTHYCILFIYLVMFYELTEPKNIYISFLFSLHTERNNFFD